MAIVIVLLCLINSKQNEINAYREFTREIYNKDNSIKTMDSFQHVQKEDAEFFDAVNKE